MKPPEIPWQTFQLYSSESHDPKAQQGTSLPSFFTVQKSDFYFIFQNEDPSLGKSPGNFEEYNFENRVFLDVVRFGVVFPFVIYLLHF